MPVGCIITDSTGKLLATGANETNDRKDSSRHCEIVAIERVIKERGQEALRTCILAVYMADFSFPHRPK